MFYGPAYSVKIEEKHYDKLPPKIRETYDGLVEMECTQKYDDDKGYFAPTN